MSARSRAEGFYHLASKGRIPVDVARALAPPAEPWTVERVRLALGLRPWPQPFPPDRGVGRTTRMLCELTVRILNEPDLSPLKAEPRTFVVVAYTRVYAERLVHDLRGMLTKLADEPFARKVRLLPVSAGDRRESWRRGLVIGAVGFDHHRA